MAASILQMYACMHPAEQAACRSMANAWRAGINRPAHVIEGFFITLLPAGHNIYRLLAWEANFRMAVEIVGEKPNDEEVYKPRRVWCRELGEAFTAGTMPQFPPRCYKLAFPNEPL